MTLNVNSLPFHPSYGCFDQTAEVRITGFRCKAALYLSYLHIKFDDEIEGNPFEFKHTKCESNELTPLYMCLF